MKILIFLALSITSFARSDGFHKPQTQAEKVLDSILTLDSKGQNVDRDKRYFTNQFVLDFKKQWSEDQKICNGVYENSCYPWDCNYLTCSQDSEYGREVNSYEILFKGTNCDNNKNTCYIELKTGLYVMKKENGKWKINSICCKKSGVEINCKN